VNATRQISRRAALAAGALTTAAAGLAAVVHLVAVDAAREALGFTFPGVPDRPTEAIAILANTARHAAIIIVAAALRGLPSVEARDTPPWMLAAGFLDATVALLCLTNVAVVGGALGAHGSRMARALLPHGPIELAAFALPLGLYLEARRRPIGWRSTAWTAASSLALLAVAAVAETYG
jgi:hypothetical protein